MAKKKNSPKKHRFKYSDTDRAVDPSVKTSTSAGPLTETSHAATVALSGARYVSQDIRKIGLLAVGLTCLEVMLWFAMTHSKFGEIIYGMVKV